MKEGQESSPVLPTRDQHPSPTTSRPSSEEGHLISFRASWGQKPQLEAPRTTNLDTRGGMGRVPHTYGEVRVGDSDCGLQP